jgi:hypothetical protein
MIVVIGSPLHRPGSVDRPSGVAGLAAGIAAAAAAAGGSVQLVGRVGEDPAGDATLLALADLGIGHVATLRDAARQTPVEPATVEDDPDPGADDDPFLDPPDGALDDRTSVRSGDQATLDPDDVGLALRYLDDYRVIVVADPLSRAGLAMAAEAAAYGGARLVAIVAGGGRDEALPEGAIVIEAPPHDPDGIFARTVGTLAVALDGGSDPAAALATAVGSLGWERSAE